MSPTPMFQAEQHDLQTQQITRRRFVEMMEERVGTILNLVFNMKGPVNEQRRIDHTSASQIVFRDIQRRRRSYLRFESFEKYYEFTNQNGVLYGVGVQLADTSGINLVYQLGIVAPHSDDVPAPFAPPPTFIDATDGDDDQ